MAKSSSIKEKNKIVYVFSDSIFLAELVCFYLDKNSNIVLSGSCTDINVANKIFTILNFNIIVLISNDIKYLTRISKTIKIKGGGRKSIIITNLNNKTVLQLIPYAKLVGILNMSSTIEIFERNLLVPINNIKNQEVIPLKTLPFSAITKREREILLLIFNGKKTKEIADTLFLSVKTIENHRNNILKKTKSKSMIHLMNLLCQIGFFNKS